MITSFVIHVCIIDTTSQCKFNLITKNNNNFNNNNCNNTKNRTLNNYTHQIINFDNNNNGTITCICCSRVQYEIITCYKN